MVEWIYGGGPVMVPIIACSVIAVAVMLDRAFGLRPGRVIHPSVVELIASIRGEEDIPTALARCDAIGGPFARIIAAGLAAASSKEAMALALRAAARQEARVLGRRLVVLQTIAGIAPLLGLLGTVVGMSEVFERISQVGLGQTGPLSNGIAQALRTTIAGLSVAIPTLIAYEYFATREENLLLEIERHANVLLGKLHPPEKGRKDTAVELSAQRGVNG